eukprot:441490-Amphidinium_carterae.1
MTMSLETKAKGETIHVGRVFGIAGIKGHELPKDHPQRKYKGRYVFQGNSVKDQDNNWAIFQELGASPASMEASKILDFHSLKKGNIAMASDPEMAYIQATLQGIKTWVRLPRRLCPSARMEQLPKDAVPKMFAKLAEKIRWTHRRQLIDF